MRTHNNEAKHVEASSRKSTNCFTKVHQDRFAMTRECYTVDYIVRARSCVAPHVLRQFPRSELLSGYVPRVCKECENEEKEKAYDRSRVNEQRETHKTHFPDGRGPK